MSYSVALHILQTLKVQKSSKTRRKQLRTIFSLVLSVFRFSYYNCLELTGITITRVLVISGPIKFYFPYKGAFNFVRLRSANGLCRTRSLSEWCGRYGAAIMVRPLWCVQFGVGILWCWFFMARDNMVQWCEEFFCSL